MDVMFLFKLAQVRDSSQQCNSLDAPPFYGGQEDIKEGIWLLQWGMDDAPRHV